MTDTTSAAGRFGRTAVLGYGTMGRGIAQVLASSGREVVAYDVDTARVQAGTRAVADFLAEGVRRGKATEDDRTAALDRITGTTTLADLAGCTLVVEAVTEDHDTKTALLTRAAEVLAADAVLATNTSALPVTDIAAALPGPHRVAGLHFFNPAPLMPVVEVVRALTTDPQVCAELEALCHDLGKTPVTVPDRPGFLVNRLLMPYLNDVIQAYDDGLADAADIDTAIELGLGHRMGPLRLLDTIGLDVHAHATRSAYDQLRDPRFAPPPLLSRMVAAGRLGAKTGRGLRTAPTDTEETP